MLQTTHAGFHIKRLVKYPHPESNGDWKIRNLLLSPLSHAGITGARRVELLPPESESDALTVMRSAYSIVTEIPRARIKDPGYAQNGRVVAARFFH